MILAARGHDLSQGNVDLLISELKKAQMDGVQLVCYKAISDVAYERGQLNEALARSIGAKIKEAGLNLALIGAYFNPVHSDKQKVQKSIDVFKEYLTYANAFGCDTVASETGSFNDDVWSYNPKNRTEDALREVSEIFKDLCGHAKTCGARVGIEGAAKHVCYNVKTLDKCCSMIGRDNLEVVFDLYNFLDANNCLMYMEILNDGLKAFRGRIKCFHLKDFYMRGGELVQCAIGSGIMDYKKILRLIKDFDENATLILEGAKPETIQKSARFLRETWRNIQ